MPSRLIQLRGITGNGTNRLNAAQGYPTTTGDNMTLGVTPCNPQYSPRNYVTVPGQAGANALVQVSATPVYFQSAWFYGVKPTDPTGGTITTANAANVYLGEKQSGTGNIYTVDPVPPGGANPVLVQANPGESLNLQDFSVLLVTIGDQLLVKYQP